jgi:phosphatidylglycerophosphate synthase
MAHSVPSAQAESLLARSRKARPATELLCDYVFRPVANVLVVVLLPLRVPPPAVVLASTATGLVAAIEIARGDLIGAAIVLQVKTVVDNADGQLARASGRVTTLGRYLDSLSDLAVDALLFSAVGYWTGRPWLALGGFLALTYVLSLDYNLERLYRDERGIGFEAMPPASGVGGILRRIYGVVYGPQDLAVERFVAWRLAGADERGRLAYHDRVTLVVLANLGLSTQLATFGVFLIVGRPDLYCWLVIGLAVATVPLLLRRELLAHRALVEPAEHDRRSFRL